VRTYADALVTVAYPLINPRGRAADRVRTWTHGQTLARGRYRVVVASDGADPSQEREVEALLGPRDELVRVPGAPDAALCNAGAARASTPWLVFTEGHCLADPGCLEALVRWVAASPAEAAGNFVIQHDGDHLLARLSRRWFGLIQARWRAPGEWPRVHRSGFAIRTDVFEAVAGFEPQYGQFAPPLLSARLHARGVAIGQIADAAVVHIDDERMRDHHADTADHGRGELAARSRADPVFFERYFGHAPIWANHPRLMARAVLAAAIACPDRGRELAASLRSLAGATVVGVAPRVALHRLAIALDELAVERLPLPAGWQWSRFLRAHARVVHCAQLEWVRRHHALPAPPMASGRWPIESLGPDTIVGVHGLEEHGGRRFRWTEPVVLLRLAPPEGEHELRIETGGLRGRPREAVVAVVAGGRVLPRALLADDDEGTLVVRFPSRWSAAARNGIVLVCSPLVPARQGVSDPRRLGLPVLSVAIAPVRAALENAAAV
jgi:hypothetical protein